MTFSFMTSTNTPRSKVLRIKEPVPGDFMLFTLNEVYLWTVDTKITSRKRNGKA